MSAERQQQLRDQQQHNQRQAAAAAAAATQAAAAQSAAQTAAAAPSRPFPKTGGAIIESMHHHGKGVYSGTFSGEKNISQQLLK